VYYSDWFNIVLVEILAKYLQTTSNNRRDRALAPNYDYEFGAELTGIDCKARLYSRQ